MYIYICIYIYMYIYIYKNLEEFDEGEFVGEQSAMRNINLEIVVLFLS